MTKTATASVRKTLSVRTGASNDLLKRKAKEKAEAADTPKGEALEDNFPVSSGSSQAEPAIIDSPAVPVEVAAVAAPMWSPEDEAAFQVLSARRKASGYRGRGRDVSAQLIRIGEIAPNPDTVVATIVTLVTDRGAVLRGELLSLMAGATFSNPKARPADKAWCQGYVAGAIRSGFLAEGAEPAVANAIT